MSEKNKRWFNRALFMLLITLTVMACGLGDSVTPTDTPEPAPPAGFVETTVAQTVEAGAPPEQPAQPATDPNAPDLVDPASNVQALKPTADPSTTIPQLRVIYSSVNVRNGPGTIYRPISALLQDSVVPVIAKNPAGTWFLIELPGGSLGWVADSVTDPVNPPAMVNVPIAATIPAPPQPTATATSTNTPVPENTATPTATATSTTAATTAATATATATPTATATTPVLPNPGVSDITVVNNSLSNVCFLFIDPSNGPWTNDLLGPTQILFIGQQLTFTFADDTYDFKAEDCNGAIINSLFNVPISGPFTWVIN